MCDKDNWRGIKIENICKYVLKEKECKILRWSEFCTSFFIHINESEIKFKKLFLFQVWPWKTNIFIVSISFRYGERSGVLDEIKNFFAFFAGYEIFSRKSVYENNTSINISNSYSNHWIIKHLWLCFIHTEHRITKFHIATYWLRKINVLNTIWS